MISPKGTPASLAHTRRGIMANVVRDLVTRLLAKLGLLGGRLFLPQWEPPDPNDPQYQPVVNPDHPLFDATVERLDVKRCLTGEYQWFTVIAFDQDGERLGGVKLKWELNDVGIGTVLDMPNYVGETRLSDGASRFFHTQRPCSYTLVVEGTWLIKNVRTNLPWRCYSNGYCTHCDPGDFVNPGPGGWLVILGPGRFGYWCYLKLK